MADDAIQRAQDAEEHRKSYEAIMKASAEIGVPFALALTMFFTNLVMANGIPVSIIAGVAVYVAVYFIVKMFFSH
ncbi:MAG: hypothetical protein AAFW81_05180 [Pseudomonadota bacterium]